MFRSAVPTFAARIWKCREAAAWQNSGLPSLGQVDSGKHSHGDTAGMAEQPIQDSLFSSVVEKEAVLGHRPGEGLIRYTL